VDCSLIVGAFAALAMAVMDKAKELPIRTMAQLSAAAALVILGALYHIFFVLWARRRRA